MEFSHLDFYWFFTEKQCGLGKKLHHLRCYIDKIKYLFQKFLPQALKGLNLDLGVGKSYGCTKTGKSTKNHNEKEMVMNNHLRVNI